MKTCNQCNQEYEGDKTFCLDCGSTLETSAASDPMCATCGTANQAGFKFCKQCGAVIGEAAGSAEVLLEPPQPVKPRPEMAPKSVESTPDVATNTQLMARPQETTVSKSAPAKLSTKATSESETTIVGIKAEVTARPIHEKTTQTTLGAAATVSKPETTVVNQGAKVRTQPNLERQPGSVERSSRSWVWPAVAGMVLLLAGGAGYLYYAGFLGKNPAKLQMILDAELKAHTLDNIHVEVGKDWVVTVSGFVENEADRGRVLGVVESNNDVKGVEDRITVASTKGGSAKGVTESPNAQSPSTRTGEDSSAKTETAPPSTQQPPSMRSLEEAIKRGTFE